VHFLTNVSVSVGGVMKPAGYEASQDVLSAAYLKDPKDPQWKNDAAMNEWRAFMTNGIRRRPGGRLHHLRLRVAKGLEQVLRQCGDELTHEKS